MQNTRVRKWAIILSEYNFAIEYKSGKTNVLADMLSRIPSVESKILVIDSSGGPANERDEPEKVEEDLTREDEAAKCDDEDILPLDLLKDLVASHQEDPDLGTIWKSLSDGEDVGDYIIRDDGFLYHVSKPVRKDEEPRLQLCVPRKITYSILRTYHDSPFGGGHGSAEKTYDKIRRRYYWPTMYRDVIGYVSKCDLCKARQVKRTLAPMQDMPIPNFPFETLAIETSPK